MPFFRIPHSHFQLHYLPTFPASQLPTSYLTQSSALIAQSSVPITQSLTLCAMPSALCNFSRLPAFLPPGFPASFSYHSIPIKKPNKLINSINSISPRLIHACSYKFIILVDKNRGIMISGNQDPYFFTGFNVVVEYIRCRIRRFQFHPNSLF